MQKRPNLLAGESLPSDPLQKRSLEKRARLKNAALALFAEKGYAGTSVEEVAHRAKTAVGGFYQHFRSKRQLLLVLMDDLLAGLSRIEPQLTSFSDARQGIHGLLTHAFSQDLRYLGACRAWEEAVLSDSALAAKHAKIRAWTTARVMALFQFLVQLPGARTGSDVAGLARAMDAFFWGILAESVRSTRFQLTQRVDSAAHLVYHALFTDHVEQSKQPTRRSKRPKTK